MDEPAHPPLIVYHIGLQIARGLADIHHMRILHRDLKVDNVLMTMKITEQINQSLWHLSVDGTLPKPLSDHFTAYSQELAMRGNRFCVLTDFGLSRDMDDPERFTNTFYGDGCWTPETSAPELFHLNEQTPTADIYSVGVLLYSICTHQGAPKPNVAFSELPDCYGEEFRLIVNDCLHVNPKARPNAGALVMRLSDLKIREADKINAALKANHEKLYRQQLEQLEQEKARKKNFAPLARRMHAAAEQWKADLDEEAARANAAPTANPVLTARAGRRGSPSDLPPPPWRPGPSGLLCRTRFRRSADTRRFRNPMSRGIDSRPRAARRIVRRRSRRTMFGLLRSRV